MSGSGKTGPWRVRVDSHEIELTNLEKVLFKESGITKGRLVSYYDRIASVMLPLIRGRPITMVRFPGGAGGEEFYQKKAPEYFPEWVNRVTIDFRDAGGKGGEKRKMVQVTCENKATLIYLANLACIPHVWTSRADKLNYPDRMIFDLDPPAGAGFEAVRYGALIIKEILMEAGIEPFVMTTGSRGLHVVVPLDREADFGEVRGFADAVAAMITRLAPDYFTSEYMKEKRGEKVFIDTYRNVFAQTTVAPYAVRSLPEAPVAAPVDWREAEDKDHKLTSVKYTMENIFERLRRKGDPWKDMDKNPFSVKRAAERLGLNPVK